MVELTTIDVGIQNKLLYSLCRRIAMRLATRALLSALTIFVLSAAVSAQTLRLPQDPRNQAPTVGTGGPGGGPTGLFTVYDGDTIRRGGPDCCIAVVNDSMGASWHGIVDRPVRLHIRL